MGRKATQLLKSRSVLWSVTALSAFVLMGYLMRGDGDAAAFMVLTGLVISFFTANMVIVLFAAVVITALWVLFRDGVPTYREPFDGQAPRKKKQGKVSARSPGPLNGPESVEATIANIEEILGSGSVGFNDRHY